MTAGGIRSPGRSLRSASCRGGARMPVLHGPAAPDEAVIDHFPGRFFVPVPFGGLSMVMSVLDGTACSGLLRAGLRQGEG